MARLIPIDLTAAGATDPSGIVQPPPTPPEDRMFFIVGRGRSGSTLLVRILNAHPSIAVAEESLFVMSLATRYAQTPWNERRVRRFARDIWYEERMHRWGLQKHALEQSLVELTSEATFARLCAEVYAASAAARGKRGGLLLGDKNPHYALFVPKLMQLFPRARFIHLVRDYRDNILSYRDVRFDLYAVGGLAYRWMKYNRAILTCAEREPERFLRVRFEDLVTAPEPHLRRICSFLGVSFTADLLCSDEGHASTALPWHQNATRPPDRRRTARWRQSMTARQCATADRICQPLGASLGYAPTRDGQSPWDALRGFGGRVLGWLMTVAEQLVFMVPLPIRSRIIRLYRIATGNRIV